MPKALRLLISALLIAVSAAAAPPNAAMVYQSKYLRVEMAPDQPSLVALAVDSLGRGALSVNPVRLPAASASVYKVDRVGSTYQYRPAGGPALPPLWTFRFSPRQIHLHSHFIAGNPPPPLVINFDPHINHATLLGLINDDSTVRLPALLHMPDLGTFRITSSTRHAPALGYDARRFSRGRKNSVDYVRVTFAAATPAVPDVDYSLEVVDIHPEVPGIAGDPRFDGFRRDWLNIFQLNPRERVLANHAASDPVAFTLFEYSSVAVHTPPLAPGLTALDMIRQTLDRYLGGMKGYGQAGYYDLKYDFSDTYPSMLMCAFDYATGSKDDVWLRNNYAGIKGWATKMLAMDTNGDGLLEYPNSGNYKSWPPKPTLRPSNWWDTIGFGHQDAYSNALAYRALLNMADLARRAGHPDDAQLYTARAEKLKSVYYATFYDPRTGVLAGWKSADGELHDYYFTFVNSVAIVFGLLPPGKASLIMDRMLAKMQGVGYTHFEYGLPGNLIPIRRGDYVFLNDKRWGGPEKEDGSDGFQIYENGGATACYAYYTLQALYQLGWHKDADAMLFPMLKGFARGGFQGMGANGMTNDWKAWDGTPHGYEGLLVDGYQALLAVLSR